MKKLITGKDVEKLALENAKSLVVDGQTIITPQARDIAAQKGIEILIQDCPSPLNTGLGQSDLSLVAQQTLGSQINEETIYDLLRLMQDRGLLNQDFLNALPIKRFREERISSGARLIYGDSLNNSFFNGPEKRDESQDISILEEGAASSLGAGYLKLRQEFECTTYEKDHIFYVIQGSTRVDIDGEGFFARQGDSFFIPKGKKFSLEGQGICQLFYSYSS